MYCLGKSHQFKDLPWAFDFEDMNYFNVQDRKWVPRKEYDEIELVRKCSIHEMPEFIFINDKDKIYFTKSKDVQITDIVGVIVKRRWRRLIFKWLRIPSYYTKVDLDCYFNPDIGDKKGTWKGE